MAERTKAVFITGGASGIGRSLAELYIKSGYSVAVFDIDPGKRVIKELNSLCTGNEQKVAGYRLDIRNDSEVKKGIRRAVKEFGNPCRAINSAGIQRADLFEESKEEDYRFVVETNLFGSRNFAAAVLPHMKEGAKLAFVSSLAGIVSNYTYAAYSSSKFGVVGLAGVLRIELKARGIGVSVICPPEIITPMVEKELLTMHPVTRKLKDFAGTIPLESACASIYRDLEKGRFMIIPGCKAKMTYFLNKFLPGHIRHLITDRMVDGVLTRMKSDR
jgi:NAD(P)-dependent dehydrogenase (short-subunit alcohol dehydrogenase family)